MYYSHIRDLDLDDAIGGRLLLKYQRLLVKVYRGMNNMICEQNSHKNV